MSTYSFFTGSGESDSPFRARDRGVKRRNAKGTSRVRPVVDGAMLGERVARGGRVGRRHFSPSQTARGFLEEAARGARRRHSARVGALAEPRIAVAQPSRVDARGAARADPRESPRAEAQRFRILEDLPPIRRSPVVRARRASA